MKLIIYTQVYENYGAHDWDGRGECPQYWKAKGGNEYVIRNVEPAAKQLYHDAAVLKINESSDYYREYVIGSDIVADDYLTEFERSQLDYDGRIPYPAVEVTVDV